MWNCHVRSNFDENIDRLINLMNAFRICSRCVFRWTFSISFFPFPTSCERWSSSTVNELLSWNFCAVVRFRLTQSHRVSQKNDRVKFSQQSIEIVRDSETSKLADKKINRFCRIFLSERSIQILFIFFIFDLVSKIRTICRSRFSTRICIENSYDLSITIFDPNLYRELVRFVDHNSRSESVSRIRTICRSRFSTARQRSLMSYREFSFFCLISSLSEMSYSSSCVAFFRFLCMIFNLSVLNFKDFFSEIHDSVGLKLFFRNW